MFLAQRLTQCYATLGREMKEDSQLFVTVTHAIQKHTLLLFVVFVLSDRSLQQNLKLGVVLRCCEKRGHMTSVYQKYSVLITALFLSCVSKSSALLTRSHRKRLF